MIRSLLLRITLIILLFSEQFRLSIPNADRIGPAFGIKKGIMNIPLLKLVSIEKSFGGIKALRNVSLDLDRGKVLSIVGENGAGKSTLMKIVAGAIQQDSGEIWMNGEKVFFQSPLDAMKKGISIVFQEPNIFSDLSVLENIFSGNELVNRSGSVDWKKMYDSGVSALRLVGLSEDVLSLSMSELSIGNQQLVLIARGIYKDCSVLILDEPTSILSHNESEKLFEIIAKLKSRGVSILYISHRIPEVLRISDNIIVMRDGQVTGSVSPDQVDETKIVTAMSGRLIDTEVFVPRSYEEKPPILRVKDLCCGAEYQDICFELRPGEILGFYGLVGAGRSEIARAVFGYKKPEKGQVLLENEDITGLRIAEIVRRHIYYVPEDRGAQGLFQGHSVLENMSAPFLDKISDRFGLILKKEERKIVHENIEKYSIKTDSSDALINNLSGGSQQKVLFCRWLLNRPGVLILDEPTRGIDVMTKTEIHKFIMDLAMQEVAIILISSDLKEIIELSDRIIVFRKGKITGSFIHVAFKEREILAAALGLA